MLINIKFIMILAIALASQVNFGLAQESTDTTSSEEVLNTTTPDLDRIELTTNADENDETTTTDPQEVDTSTRAEEGTTGNSIATEATTKVGEEEEKGITTTVTQSTTRPTTTQPRPCRDQPNPQTRRNDCARLRSQGLCGDRRFASVMNEICPLTCRVCRRTNNGNGNRNGNNGGNRNTQNRCTEPQGCRQFASSCMIRENTELRARCPVTCNTCGNRATTRRPQTNIRR